jgi:hypothetical protein
MSSPAVPRALRSFTLFFLGRGNYAAVQLQPVPSGECMDRRKKRRSKPNPLTQIFRLPEFMPGEYPPALK